jgi:hypothetical protein
MGQQEGGGQTRRGRHIRKQEGRRHAKGGRHVRTTKGERGHARGGRHIRTTRGRGDTLGEADILGQREGEGTH